MSYRDDRDADQARIEALELELARARDRISELEGKQSLRIFTPQRHCCSRSSIDSLQKHNCSKVPRTAHVTMLSLSSAVLQHKLAGRGR